MQESEDAIRNRSSVQGVSKINSFRPYHAIRVPKSTSLETVFPNGCSDEMSTEVTTVMLRHIPNKYTQGNLLQELDQMGFTGRFDFFYLPMDVHNRTNVGYAFINFLSPQDAQLFECRMTDYKFQKYCSQKIAKVAPAHIQGLVRNLYHFANRAVSQSQDMQYRPIVMCNGVPRDCIEVLEDHRRARTERSHGNEMSGFNGSANALVPDKPPDNAQMTRYECLPQRAWPRGPSLPVPDTNQVPMTSLSAPPYIDGMGTCNAKDAYSHQIEEEFSTAIFHLKQASAALVNLGIEGMLQQPNTQVIQSFASATDSIAARLAEVGTSVTGLPWQDNSYHGLRSFTLDKMRSDNLSTSSSTGSTTPPQLNPIDMRGYVGMRRPESALLPAFAQSDPDQPTPRMSQILQGFDFWKPPAPL